MKVSIFTGIAEILISRKFVYATLSMLLITSLYLLNLYLMTNNPALANPYISMFDRMLSFTAGLVGGLLGLHQFMDWSTTNANTNSTTTSVTNAITTTVSDAVTKAESLTNTNTNSVNTTNTNTNPSGSK